MKKAIFILVGMFFVSVLSVKAFACGGWFESACGTSTQQVMDNQQKMETAVPVPQLQDSLERTNISKRLQEFSDPNKVSYIYLISFGKVMAFYTVKGKVTSGSKRLTSSQQIVDTCGNLIDPGHDSPCGSNMGIVQAPELDGTYGDSGNYIYFWTTSGIYVQWNSEYMMADQPLTIAQPPELVEQVK